MRFVDQSQSEEAKPKKTKIALDVQLKATLFCYVSLPQEVES